MTSSAVGLKICAITAEIQEYMSIIKKKRKKHDKTVLLGKVQLDTIFCVLIYKSLISLFISHGEFDSRNNMLREHNVRKEEIKNQQNALEYTL